MKGNKNMKKLGFTLAEVLITLVIIGVIAAMTVPTLMNNTNAQEFRSALKKAISGANQALTLHYALEGLSAQDYTSPTDLAQNVFRKRMSIISGASGTDAQVSTRGTNGNSTALANTSVDASWVTADGMIFSIDTAAYKSDNSDEQTSKCNSYNTVPCSTGAANLWIDVNGSKNPNTITSSSKRPKDIYQAHIYAQKVLPYGAPTQEVMFDKKVVAS